MERRAKGRIMTYVAGIHHFSRFPEKCVIDLRIRRLFGEGLCRGQHTAAS
jgi:hypothetical protein